MYGQMLLRPILFVIMVHVLTEPCGYYDVTSLDVIRLLFSCLFVILVWVLVTKAFRTALY